MPKSPTPKTEITLSNEAIKIARQELKLSQRDLADRIGKSQSWIRDIEKGRFGISEKDQALLRQELKLPEQ